MPARAVLAAVAVMVVWGMNFVVIDRGLAGVPPLVCVALRFSVVLLALPFVARPASSLSSASSIASRCSPRIPRIRSRFPSKAPRAKSSWTTACGSCGGVM